MAWSWVPEHPALRLPVKVERFDEVVIAEQQVWRVELAIALQLIFVTHGELTLTQHGQTTTLSVGACAIVRQGVITTTHATPARFTALSLQGVVADHMLSGWSNVIQAQDTETIERALGFMRRTLQRHEPDVFERLSVQAYRLLLHLSLHEQEATPDSPNNPTVAAAINLLQNCPARDLDVRRIANSVGVSVSHLHRLFKRVLNTTPLNYAHQMVIARARIALSTTDQSCSEIARQLGYDDPLYFSAVFKRHTGESPRTYRRRTR
jgi:AraC-like DNA-binding protein